MLSAKLCETHIADIQRGIFLMGEYRTAVRANPFPGTAAQAILYMASNVAGFGGGGIAVNDDEGLALFRQFVFEAFPEHPETGIHHIPALYVLRKPD